MVELTHNRVTSRDGWSATRCLEMIYVCTYHTNSARENVSRNAGTDKPRYMYSTYLPTE